MTASHPAPSASQIELLAERNGPDRARRTAPDSPGGRDSLDSAVSSTEERGTPVARQEIDRAQREDLAPMLRWTRHCEPVEASHLVANAGEPDVGRHTRVRLAAGGVFAVGVGVRRLDSGRLNPREAPLDIFGVRSQHLDDTLQC